MIKDKEKLIILDSHALIHRAYHALPVLTSPTGQSVQAVYGFFSVLLKVLKEMKPDYVAAAFDLAGPTFRHQEFKEYKSTRPKTDDELIQQFPLVRKTLEIFGIPALSSQGFEADDIIGAIVEQVKNKKDLQVIIVTGDLDTLQLVRDDQIVVCAFKKGVSETIIYNDLAVKERFDGLGPDQMIDYKGLKGDPSDNIPGVPGIGEKTAITLLKEYGSLEKIYEAVEKISVKSESQPEADQPLASAKSSGGKSQKSKVKITPKNLKLFEKLSIYKDQAFFSRKLATIKRDAPIVFDLDKARFNFSESDQIKKAFNDFGFKTLFNRLQDILNAGDQKNQKQLNVAASLFPDEIEEYYRKGIFSEKIYKLEKSLQPVLRRIEKIGFLINVDRIKKLNKKVNLELSNIKKEVANLAGEDFNLNSSQELGRIIFEKLALGGLRLKKTKTGAFSTAFEELGKIKNSHPIVPLMLKWRELAKLQSTYLEALPKLINSKDGRIHTTFKQFGAVTGRLASENPNLQNIPIKSEHSLELRKAFIAQEGYLILAADYSQIELRVAAALSGDKKMIEAFKRGQDIHTRTASEIFNTPLEKINKDMRQRAKILNFGILYGMGSKAFSQAADLNLNEAKQFIEEYYADFSRLIQFMEEIKLKAYTRGYAETLWGRKRYLNDLKSPNPRLRAAAERMAINMPIQGTATGDIIKAAMVALDQKLVLAKDINMILQVHDEIIFEVKKESLKKYIPIIKEVMESIAQLEVPMEVELEAGKSWGEMEKI